MANSSKLITNLPPDVAFDRASYGDQTDMRIDNLRDRVIVALDDLEGKSSGGTSSVLTDSTGIPTATSGAGMVLGSGAEGQVTQMAVAAMAVRIQTGGTAYNNQGQKITIPVVLSLPITAADATNPRKDIVVVDPTGTVIARAGTPAGSPVDPTLTLGDVPLARVAVAANATTVVTANITDLRSRSYIDGTKLKDGTINASALISFESTVQTGTGANLNIAHGKSKAPLMVWWALSDTNAIALPYVFTPGTHDATNIVMNVTTGVKFKVFALF